MFPACLARGRRQSRVPGRVMWRGQGERKAGSPAVRTACLPGRRLRSSRACVRATGLLPFSTNNKTLYLLVSGLWSGPFAPLVPTQLRYQDINQGGLMDSQAFCSVALIASSG
ncbi:hypothetical protein PoB_007411700 [Plakobranchus ocellatus]|uniref:Uncharacterized protein n=1 Tax=Plakobranchus ocellatus TaxID=259542 RepID=A0AAV4DTF8_9GAST|nr:hypothetical protein PoB_007411700 [Plakobranchus ocellatus]